MALRSSSLGNGPVSGTAALAGGAGLTSISNIGFTADLGTVVTLNGLTASRTITGLATTDQVFVQCTGVLPVGIAIGNARVSATNTLELRFVTSVVGNVALGSLAYRVTVFR